MSQHGIVQTYWQWLDLPHAVAEHCRLVMAAEGEMKKDDSKPTKDLLANER